MKKLTHLLLPIAVLLMVGLAACENGEETDDDDIAVTGVSLNNEELTFLVGDQYDLTAFVEPGDATERSVEWHTSDSSIVEVMNGSITAVGVGSAVITVTTVDGGYTASCNIIVKPILVNGVSLNQPWVILAKNGKYTLTTSIYPENATDQQVVWSTSDPSIVTVTNGVVTGISEGEAKITATTVDGGHTSDCNVAVLSSAMTMTTDAFKVSLSLKGSTGISIDWGDGDVEFHSLTNETILENFSHEFSDSVSSAHTITITGYDITYLNCSRSNIRVLDVSKNIELKELACGENLLTVLNVSNNTNLKNLSCDNNQLTTLDISKNIELERLYCPSNLLASLKVNNPILKTLECQYNKLTTLDVSSMTDLNYLDCNSNLLTTLTMKGKKISVLDCSNNRLTSLDGTAVGYFRIQDNRFEVAALNTLFTNLMSPIPGAKASITIYNNPGTDDCNISIARNKGWEVISIAP